MRDIVITFILLIVLTGCTLEYEQIDYGTDVVTLSKCIDGDTFWALFEDGHTEKIRLILVDTPETTNEIEPRGKEASEFTCNLLSNANEIVLEYDFEKYDKYDRTLAYVYVDGNLLQKELASNGYVEKIYDYGTYKHELEIKKAIKDVYGIYENN